MDDSIGVGIVYSFHSSFIRVSRTFDASNSVADGLAGTEDPRSVFMNYHPPVDISCGTFLKRTHDID